MLLLPGLLVGEQDLLHRQVTNRGALTHNLTVIDVRRLPRGQVEREQRHGRADQDSGACGEVRDRPAHDRARQPMPESSVRVVGALEPRQPGERAVSAQNELLKRMQGEAP